MAIARLHDGVRALARSLALMLVFAGLAAAAYGLRIGSPASPLLIDQVGALAPRAGAALIGAGLGTTALGVLALSILRRLRRRS